MKIKQLLIVALLGGTLSSLSWGAVYQAEKGYIGAPIDKLPPTQFVKEDGIMMRLRAHLSSIALRDKNGTVDFNEYMSNKRTASLIEAYKLVLSLGESVEKEIGKTPRLRIDLGLDRAKQWMIWENASQDLISQLDFIKLIDQARYKYNYSKPIGPGGLSLAAFQDLVKKLYVGLGVPLTIQLPPKK